MYLLKLNTKIKNYLHICARQSQKRRESERYHHFHSLSHYIYICIYSKPRAIVCSKAQQLRQLPRCDRPDSRIRSSHSHRSL